MKSRIIGCFLVLALIHTKLEAQLWTITEKTSMPKRTSNNAVTEGLVNGIPTVFSFAGIDSTKLFSGIHLQSFKYNTIADTWLQIPDLPDTLGKIACSASNVKNKIYIIGGYHVFVNGNEVSSNKVHIYAPETNQYLSDGANIPIAIDDQVQCVWRDSLIYVITGWSNNTNVPNVQIYNPSTNSWSVGTSTPNTNIYKVFGAAGVIKNDTIYYYGGASTATNFPAQKQLRIGIINPQNPLEIEWNAPLQHVNNYRCAATTDSLGNIYFLGGSATSYNYNGIAYNGSGGVAPIQQYHYFNTSNIAAITSVSSSLPMDLRGIANINFSTKYIVGGMEEQQQVSNKTLELNFVSALGINKSSATNEQPLLYPNPCKDFITIRTINNSIPSHYCIYNIQGEQVLQGLLPNEFYTISIGSLAAGFYYITSSNNSLMPYKFVKANE